MAMLRPTWRTSCGCFLKYGGTMAFGFRGSRWMNTLGPCKRAIATSFFLGKGWVGVLIGGGHSARVARTPGAAYGTREGHAGARNSAFSALCQVLAGPARPFLEPEPARATHPPPRSPPRSTRPTPC